MTVQLYLPKLGMAMEDGTIVEWLVADGDLIAAGQPIYVVDNDKVETEIESQIAGRIRLLVRAGETWAVGTPVADVEPA